MTRGRKPTPTHLKLVMGNPGRRPINADEPRVEVEIPAPPELLKGEALKEWQRLTPMLADAGLLTKLDRNMVAAYCRAWARWVECEKFLEKTGLIVMSPNKMPIYSPYLSAANKAMEQMRQLSEQLGLSASARSRIKATPPAGIADPAEAFLGRGRHGGS